MWVYWKQKFESKFHNFNIRKNLFRLEEANKFTYIKTQQKKLYVDAECFFVPISFLAAKPRHANNYYWGHSQDQCKRIELNGATPNAYSLLANKL